MRLLSFSALAVASMLLAAGSGSAARDAQAAPTRVNVAMTDYAFALSKRTVRPGTVVFHVVNKGEVVHDFRIAGKKTPIYDSGQGGTLRVVFNRSGRFPYVCTITGHALAGMKGTLRVVK